MSQQTHKTIYLFHIYQPPWQRDEIVLDHYEKYYLPLLKVIQKQDLHLTLNLAGSLTEHLARFEKFEFFELLEKLVLSGNIELTGSAMYHPILPLIPESETIRQIELNDAINSKYLPRAWKLSKKLGQGFYLPEVAYSPKVSKLVARLGFKYLTIDETAFNFEIDYSKKYIDLYSGLELFINNRKFRVSEKEILANFPNKLFISDGERQVTEDQSNLIKTEIITKFFGGVKHLTVSKYLDSLDNEVKVKPMKSNWESVNTEIEAKSYYHQWDNKSSEIHQRLWKLINSIIKLVNHSTSDSNYKFVRSELDRALSSCTWWWVDGRFLGYSPTEVTIGLNVIINVVRSLQDLNLKTRLKYEKEYSKLLYLIWEKHWENRK